MSDNKNSIRTPLGYARGLGSSKEGTHHWWMQRVSSIALVPLSLYWLSCLPEMTTGTYAHFISWIGSPLVAIIAILFILTSFYHAALGLQVIIEDYITREGAKLSLLMLNNFTFIALGAACVFAILHISFSLHRYEGP
jgi:succinate dehydrogenase / fumarate reductase, membrane anchor subunit